MAAWVIQPVWNQLHHRCAFHDFNGPAGTAETAAASKDQVCFLEDPASISLFTLGAWHCFLSALSGLSVFEFGAMSLLSPVVMAALAMLILRERPSPWIWPAIGLGMAGGWLMVNVEWQGWSSGYYHAFMLGALLFSSLRWITVKYAGESVPASAMIFWEPIMVLLVMGSIIDLAGLWNKMTPMLFSSAVLLFLSRQCLVRSLPDPSHICHFNLRSDIH